MSDSYQAEIQSAIKASVAGDVEGAVLALNLIIKGNPENIDAVLALGKIHEDKKDWANALSIYYTFEKINASSRECYEAIIRTLINSGEIDLIPNYLEKWKSIFSEDEFYFQSLSDFNRLLGNTDGIIEANQKILEKHPNDYWALYRLAGAQIQKGNFEIALEALEKAKLILPDAPYVDERIAFIELRTGKVEQAVARLYENLKANPNHIWTMEQILKILGQVGHYDKAKQIANEFYEHFSSAEKEIINMRLGEIARDEAFENRIIQNKEALAPILEGCTMVDVGAVDGFQWFWRIVARQGLVNAVGFEPDIVECTALTAMFPFGRFIPSAVGGTDGPSKFRITRVGLCSSLLEPDFEVLDRFPVRSCFEVVKTLEMDVRSLETIMKEDNIERVDFMKIDVQGAEADILTGLGEKLDKVLAVELEAQILKLYKGQKTFFELIELLGEKGFRLRGIEPQGTFEGEVVEIEAYFAKDLSLLSELEKKRLFLWEAIVSCPQMSFMADNMDLASYPKLRQTVTQTDYWNANARKEVRKLILG